MSDTDLELKFGADASGAVAASKEMQAEVADIDAEVKGLAATMKAMGAATTAAFHEGAVAAKEQAEAMKGVAEAVTEFREMISGIGEALMAAFAVEAVSEFAKRMAETAEAVLHTAQTFGLGVGEVQRLNAEAALFGVPAEAMATAMARIDKSFQAAKGGSAQAAAAFKEIGISLSGSYTQTQLMQAALDGLSKMDAGPAKVAAAMAIFGKNIQAIGPLLGLTQDQMEEANKTIEEYGAVNEKAAAKGVALAESMNTGKVAAMGVHNVMADALAPVFKAIVDDLNKMSKAFIDSYNSGGVAKIGMDALAIAMKAVVAGFDTMTMVAKTLYDVLKGLGSFVLDFAKAVVEAFANMAGQAGESFASLGRMMGDALTGHLDQATAEHERYLAYSRVANGQLGQIWSQFAAKATGDGSQMFSNLTDDAVGYFNRMKALVTDQGASADLPAAGKGTTKGDHGKAGKDHSAELAEAAREDELARMAAQNEAFKQGMSAYFAESESAENTKAAIIRQGAAEQIAVIKDQIKDIDQAEKEGQISHQQAHSQRDALILQERQIAVQAAADIRDSRIQADNFALQIATANSEEYKRLEKDKTAAAIAFNKAVTAANIAAGTEIQANNRKTAADYYTDWTKTLTPIVAKFGQITEGLINQTMTWRQAMTSILMDVENAFFRMAEGLVVKWASTELAKVSISRASATAQAGVEQSAAVQSKLLHFETNEKQIYSDAAAAAASAYKAMAGIPIIGPELGAVAAGVTFAAVEAYGNMASAAGGYDIPSGLNPIVQAHAQEMILPARLANPIRAMADSYNGAQRGGGSSLGGGGETHLHTHHWQINGAIDGASLQRVLQNNAGAHAKAMESLVRGRNGRGFGFAT